MKLSAHRFRVARRWRAAAALEFLLAAVLFFFDMTAPGMVLIAAGLFATFAAMYWESKAGHSRTAEAAWDVLRDDET